MTETTPPIDPPPPTDVPPPPGGPSPDQQLRLTRDSSSTKLAGVALGLSHYLGVDVVLVRLGWMALAVASGFIPAIILYEIAAMVMPETTDGDVHVQREQRLDQPQRRVIVFVGLGILALLVLPAVLGAPGIVKALLAGALVIGGVAVLNTSPQDVADTSAAPILHREDAGRPPSFFLRFRRRTLGRFVLYLTPLWFALIGIGLLAGGTATGVVDLGEFSAGERHYQPATLDELPSDLQLTAGEILIDLSEVDEFAELNELAEARPSGEQSAASEPSERAPAPKHMQITATAAEITILVPRHAPVVIDPAVKVGDVTLDGGAANYIGTAAHDGALLIIDADLKVGEIIIKEVAAP